MKKGSKLSIIFSATGLIVMLFVGLIGGYFWASSVNTPKVQAALTGVVNIGAALPLSGDLSASGETAQVALTKAKDQINALLQVSGAGYSIELIFADTQTKPDVALQVTKDLHAAGCQVILGYYSSGELNYSMVYAQENHIVLISPCSTATSLSIDKPFIYRFVTADNKQGPAMAKGMVSSGVSYVVPIWRADVYGDGLVEATISRFVELGCDYDQTAIRYSIYETDFSDEVAALANQVQAAVDLYGADAVGVYAVSFEEITSIMTCSVQHPVLSQVKWFGCDTTALITKILEDSDVANFSITTSFSSTRFAPTNSELLTELYNYIHLNVSRVPDPSAYCIYDSLWVVVKCIGLTQSYNSSAINMVLPEVANMTFGASGWCALNDFGDRAIGDYEFWQVYYAHVTSTDGADYSWYKSGLYTVTTDSITAYAQP